LQLGGAMEYSPDRELAARLLRELNFAHVDDELAASLQQDLQSISEGEALAHASFLPALLSPFSLLDHLPEDCLIVLDEPSELAEALDEYTAETTTMRIEREARG